MSSGPIIFSACSTPEESKAKHFEKGMNYFQEDKYKEAVIEFKNVVQIDPECGPGHYQVALALKGMKKVDAAKEEFQKAINTKEEFPEIEDARRLLEELS